MENSICTVHLEYSHSLELKWFEKDTEIEARVDTIEKKLALFNGFKKETTYWGIFTRIARIGRKQDRIQRTYTKVRQ